MFSATTKNPISLKTNPSTKEPKPYKQPRICFQIIAVREEAEPSQSRVHIGLTLEEAHELRRGNTII